MSSKWHVLGPGVFSTFLLTAVELNLTSSTAPPLPAASPTHSGEHSSIRGLRQLFRSMPSVNAAGSNLGAMLSVFPPLCLQPNIWDMVLIFYCCFKMQFPHCSQLNGFVSVFILIKLGNPKGNAVGRDERHVQGTGGECPPPHFESCDLTTWTSCCI